jgi:glycosyltransferase involved in cell wall biosynthesis
MKILYVSETYIPDHGGMPTLIENFTQGLAGQGHDVRLWTRGNRRTSYAENHNGVTIYRQRSTPYPLSSGHRVTVGTRTGLANIVADWMPDVIHVHIFPSPITAVAIAYGKRNGIPVVITNHAMPENYRNVVTFRAPAVVEKLLFPLGWRYIVNICNQATLVTTPTPTALGYLKDNGLKRPSLAISNGIDTDMYKPASHSPAVRKKFHLPQDKPLLLYLGRLDGEKMIEIIIAALPHLKQGYHLAIAGGGNNDRQLKALTAKLGLKPHVTFIGVVSTADKIALYQNADIFVIASPAELQSIVVLEAMSSRLPIVAVAAGALTELCLPGKNGLLFKLNDPLDLAAQLEKLLSSPQLCTTYGLASRQIVERSHSLHATILAYEAAYQKLIARSAKPASRRRPKAVAAGRA